MSRRRRPLAVSGLILVAALIGSACENRALMAPDGRYVYWANGASSGGSQQPPQRLATGDLALTPLPAVPGGSPLRAGLMAPDGGTAYVITEDGRIHRLSLPSGAAVGTSSATSLSGLSGNIPMAAISPDGSTAILGSPTSDLLVRIDLATLGETTSRTVGNGSGIKQTAAFTPDGQHLIAAQHQAGSPALVRVRASDLAVVAGPTAAGLGTDFVAGVVLSADGTVGYAIGETAVYRFDATTLEPTGAITYDATIGIQQGSLMRSPDGERLYLLDTAIPSLLHTFDLVGMRELPTRATTLPALDDWGVLTPDGRTAYLGGDSGYHERIDVATANPLSLTVTGPGAVRVSSAASPCYGICAYDILDYRTVTLTAAPAAGAVFTGWSGACTGSAATCALPMSAARTVTAAFTAAPTAAPAPSNRVRGLRTTARAGSSGIAFTTVLRVPGPGRLAQTVAVAPRGRSGAAPWVLCRTSGRPAAAGAVTLVCETGLRARAALARRPLAVTVTTVFRPTGGTAATTRRTLALPRTPQTPAAPVTG